MTDKKDELPQEDRSQKKKPKGEKAQEIGRFIHRPLQDYLDPEYDYDDEEDTRRTR